MGRYRRIQVCIWNDDKFPKLSDDGKLVFLFLLTHPHMTALGAMRANRNGLAAELGWVSSRFKKAFGEAFAKGMVQYDESASCLVLPKFMRHNPPESPNVVRAWNKAVDLIPDCNLKYQLLQQVKGFLEGLGKGFAEAWRQPSPNPDPEQEQEEETNSPVADATRRARVSASRNGTPAGFEEWWSTYRDGVAPRPVRDKAKCSALWKAEAFTESQAAALLSKLQEQVDFRRQAEREKQFVPSLPDPIRYLKRRLWHEELHG